MGHGDSHDDEPLDDHDEGPDEELAAPLGAPPDPLDRTWVHPTELPVLNAAFAPPPELAHTGAARTGARWFAPVLAGVAGALVTVSILGATGTFHKGSSSTASLNQGSSGFSTPSLTDMTTRLGPSLVAIAVHDAKGARRGSGVCIRHGRDVLTTGGVVGDAQTVTVVTTDGERHAGRVVGRDKVTDLVLLSLDAGADVRAAPLSEQSPAAGSHIWIMGAPAPGALSPWMSGGMVSSIDALVWNAAGPTTAGLLESDAGSSNAAEGGALVDSGGSVAGIVLGHLDGSTTTFAIPIATAVTVAEELKANGKARHGSLGLDGADAPAGPTVVSVTPKGPAARAGVRAGDFVEAIDGRAVDTIGDVTAIVRGKSPGQTVVVSLRRRDTDSDVRVVLGAIDG